MISSRKQYPEDMGILMAISFPRETQRNYLSTVMPFTPLLLRQSDKLWRPFLQQFPAIFGSNMDYYWHPSNPLFS